MAWLDDEEEVPEEGQTEETEAEKGKGKAEAKDEPEDADDDEEPEADEGAAAGAKADKKVPLAALQDERNKRKALRSENEDLKRRIDALDRDVQQFKQQGAAKKEEAEPDFDPEGLFDDSKKVFGKFENRIQEKRVKERVLESWEASRYIWDDFDEVVTLDNVNRWVSKTPGAQASMRESRAPAQLAYRSITKMIKAEEAEKNASSGDSPKLKELEAKLNDLIEENKELRKKTGKPPRSVSGSRSTSARSADDDELAGVFNKY